MKEEIRHFMNSGLLEQYVLGLTSPQETRKVEEYIKKYPEVCKVHKQLKIGMDSYMMDASEFEVEQIPNKKSIKTNWKIGATAGLLLMAACTLFVLNIFKQSKIETLTEKITHNEDDRQENINNTSKLKEQLRFINDSETKKYILKGNDKAKDFQVVVYWNDSANRTVLHLNKLPPLPDDKCFQMWAGEKNNQTNLTDLTNLGVIKPSKEPFIDLVHYPNAKCLKVTIEPKGGSNRPTFATLIANVYNR